MFEPGVDYISDFQHLICWSFSADVLEQEYATAVYAQPVADKVCAALAAIAASGNKRIRRRRFTIFAGDGGPGFSEFKIGIPASVSSRITALMTGFLCEPAGYLGISWEDTPFTPLIPFLRYEYGNLCVYTGDASLAGRVTREYCDHFHRALRYRRWESAEGCGVWQHYAKKPEAGMTGRGDGLPVDH